MTRKRRPAGGGRLDFPRIQGADIAGTVVRLGDDTDPALLDTRVLVDPALYDSTDPHAHPVGLLGSERDGGYAASFDIRRLYLHNKALIGSSMHTPAHFALPADIARQGQIAPVIAAVFELGEVHHAQAELASRSHVGKIVLTPDTR